MIDLLKKKKKKKFKNFIFKKNTSHHIHKLTLLYFSALSYY